MALDVTFAKDAFIKGWAAKDFLNHRHKMS
jgi:hypothetical protein